MCRAQVLSCGRLIGGVSDFGGDDADEKLIRRVGWRPVGWSKEIVYSCVSDCCGGNEWCRDGKEKIVGFGRSSWPRTVRMPPSWRSFGSAAGESSVEGRRMPSSFLSDEEPSMARFQWS